MYISENKLKNFTNHREYLYVTSNCFRDSKKQNN